MTATDYESQVLPEEFDEATRRLGRTAREFRLELIDGKIRSKALPDGNHGTIIEWLTRVCLRSRPELWLNADQGLKVGASGTGRARADGALAPSEAFIGQGCFADPGQVLMTVAVTSYDSGTAARDRSERPRVYAGTGIPVHLLIDRDSREVTVHSEPDGVRYESARRVPFGKEITLPEPVGITLATERLKEWVR
jgi:Uma2 family endonuclease